MAERANWKGYLRLSLVSCPVALYPATSDREKIRFHQINRRTGHRIKMQRVDAETGKAVDYEDVVKGYEAGKDNYVAVSSEELETIELESTRTIDIDRFVPAEEIDPLYYLRPYYITPDDEAGEQAFAVIRETLRKEDKVALGRVVLTNREHVIALQARGKGIMGMLLRYPYEVRDEKEYFADIGDVDTPKDMIELASHILRGKAGHFEPKKFVDHYETALRELLRQKEAGRPIEAKKHREPARVINLMDALRRSVEAGGATRARAHPTHAAKRTARSRRAG
jgi:DNA end-binding protein Ku